MKVLKIALIAILTGAIVWLLVFSNYGALDYFHYKRQIKELQGEVTKLQIRRQQLLSKTEALKNCIDSDVLETQVREILCYVRNNEEIYYI